MKKTERIVVWYRKDLRLHDNEALIKALDHSQEVIPVFVFDKEVLLGETLYGFKKTGKYRAKFLLESIAQLRQSFREKGIDLVIRFGKAEEEVFELVKSTGASMVYANMERTHDEVIVQDSLEKNLWSIGLELQFFRGKMLYYTQDFPFPISHSPDSFTSFRKEVERFVPIREPFPVPDNFNPWTIDIEVGDLPTLKDMGLKDFAPDERSEIIFTGGEVAALQRLQTFLGDNQYIDYYHNNYCELQGLNNSSKLSPWLANGALSPKYVYTELKAYEQRYKSNKSTQDFFLELLYRDYYRLMGKKYGDRIFEEGGISGTETKNLSENKELFESWIEGQTESALVNACMQQLKHTGYLSQKGRHIVSSYLINDLKISWRMGAAYFQHILIDYDICSNWVNWNVVGGVGPDPKDDRYINIENQARRLDPNQEYINRWLEDSLQCS